MFVVCPSAEGALARAGQTTKCDRLSYRIINLMPDLQISKPAAGEYNPYYSKYIDRVPDGDVVGTLASQIGGTLAALRGISEADSLKRYAPGKWSIREMIGHMNDTERIF